MRRGSAIFCVLILCALAQATLAEEVAPSALNAVDPTENPDPTLARVSLSPLTGLVFTTQDTRLELHGYAWLRAQTDTRVGKETDLEASVPVGRIFATGSLLDSKLHFFAQPEFAGSKVRLLDLFAEWHFDPAFQLRAGQFRTPYSRAFITPLTNLELPTRGLLIDHFGQGRDTGVMASGSLASDFFHYDLAVVNGATINDHRGDRDAPAVIARTEFNFGDPVPRDQAPSLVLDDPHGVTLGFGGAFSRRAVRGPTGTSTEELWNAAADVAWMHGPISLRTEGFFRSAHRSPRAANAFGVYAQLGVFVLPRQLEVGGRAGWLTDGPDVQTYEAFVASYWKTPSYTLGHHLKTIFAYRYDSRDAAGVGADSRDRHIVQIQTQIFF